MGLTSQLSAIPTRGFDPAAQFGASNLPDAGYRRYAREGETMSTPTDGERLVRIETKLDAALSKDDDHEQRLRKLEERRWPVPAAALLLSAGALATTIVGMLT